MKIRAALLCDAGTVRDNLLHVLGGGVTIIEIAAHPSPARISFALALELDQAEKDKEHQLGLSVAPSSGGDPLATITGAFTAVGKPRHDDIPLQVSVVVPLDGVVFPKPDLYKIEIAFDSEIADQLTFATVDSPGQGPPSSPEG